MGDFARVALPVAAAAAMPFATGAAALATTPVSAGSIALGTEYSLFVQGMSPWMIAANAGLTGLSEIGAMRQESAQQRAAEARTAAASKSLRDDFERQERRRRERLKQQVATQRARFGAQGVSTQGGSAAAVVAGLESRSDADGADLSADYNRKRMDLLEAARPARRDNFKLFQKTVSPFLNLLD